MHVDVLVVGGGPIGAVAARCAAEAGATVLLVERRDNLRLSSCCTGLVSPRTVKILGASEDCVLREIRSIKLHSPNGQILNLAADHAKAVVIDRARLEQGLHVRMRDAGVDVRLGTEVVRVSDEKIIVSSSDGEEQLTAAMTVGADGPRSRIARQFDLPCPEQFVHGAQAVVEMDRHAASDTVEVFLGEAVAPGFFGWAVPAEESQLRVGLGVTPPRDPSEYLDRLLAKWFPEANVISRAGGQIPISPVARSATHSVLLVGDAAGQVKPLSGGGLYSGGVCARIAGRIAATTALSGQSGDRAAASYESEWRSAIGREIAFGQSMRRISGMLTDHDLNALFAACEDRELLSFLSEHADIDRFHRLPDELAVHPLLWKKVLRLLPLITSREITEPA